MASKTKNQAKTYFVVSGNINGNEDDALISKSAKSADYAICGKVIGALGEMGYVDADGRFPRVAVVVYMQSKSKGNTCTTVYNLNDFGEVREFLASDEHIVCITLRRMSATHTFAEWKLSKARV